MFYIDKGESKNNRQTTTILLKSWYLPKSTPLVWSTGISINPDHWNSKTNSIKKANPNATWLNALLAKYASTCEQFIARRKAEDFAPPTHEAVKAELNNLRDQIDGRKRTEATTAITFLEYFANYVEAMRTNPKYSPRTYYHPGTTLTNLRLYCQHKKTTINWPDLSLSLFEDWQQWAFAEVVADGAGNVLKDQLSQNTVAGYWKKFKAVLKAAAADGHYLGKDHERPSLAVSFQVSDQIYFDVDELMAIYHANLPKYLHKHRDWALFNAFCGGFRFTDLSEMGQAAIVPMLKADGIRFHASKTDTEVVIPGSWFFDEFRAKYPDQWPDIGSHQKFNDAIKEMARIAGIRQKVRIRINKGGQDQYIDGEKWEFAHQYTLRYSFATNLDEAGVDINDISRLMGHKVLRTTQGYIKTRLHKVALKVASNPYFTTKPAQKAAG
jgi:site-specific recombinase XerD